VTAQRPLRVPVWLKPELWLAVGFGLRLVHFLTLGNRYYFGDTAEYEQVALRILHGLGIGASSPRAPIYPLWLAASFALGGEQNYVVARLMQLLLSLVHMGLTVKLARRLGGPAGAVFAAPLVALTPTIVFITGLLYPTLVYSTLLMAITLAAWDLVERPGAWAGVRLAVLAVLGWLTDMVIVAPLLAIGVWLLTQLRGGGPPMRRGLAVAAVVVVGLALPYLSALRSGGNERMFMGKAQAVLHFARTDPELSRSRWIRTPDATFEGLSATGFARREWTLFRERPLAYLHDYTLELVHFFQPLPDRVTSRNRYSRWAVYVVGAAWFSVLLLFAMLGTVRGAGPRRGRLLVAGVVLGTAAFYAFFFTQTRYRIPIEAHMIVLVALALEKAFPRVSRLLDSPGAGATGPHLR